MLRTRDRLVGTFLMLPRVEIVEMLGASGFDLVFIDLEHGSIGPADVPVLTAAAANAGMRSVVRVGESAPATIGLVLDGGADAVMIPHVSSPAEAIAAVRSARFPDEGERSLNPYARGNRYGIGAPSLASLNEDVAVIAMVEGGGALAHLDEIMATDGIDGFFVGPVDLSAALGHPGQPDHPEVVATIESIFARADDGGRSAGLYVDDPSRAQRWFDLGAHFAAVSADVAMAVAGFQTYRGRIG